MRLPHWSIGSVSSNMANCRQCGISCDLKRLAECGRLLYFVSNYGEESLVEPAVYQGKLCMDCYKKGLAIMRTLECSNAGDPRFSALNARVIILGTMDTIENHYQLAKRFDDKQAPDWRTAKKWQHKGKKYTSIM